MSEEERDVQVPLRKLVELALVHAEIGPPLAELAFAIGHKETGDQLLRLGTERENPQLEYFFIASQAARRARRHGDALKATLDALRVFESGTYGPEDGERLLHLVRAGLSVLMFDLKDVTAEPEFTRALGEAMPRLEDRLGELPMYHSLLAQALWFTDKDASEREWERARDLGDAETSWNARGTWYKEAEKDLEKAERAYRRGMEKAPGSGLLMHNLAQVLVERAENAPSPGGARHLLNQAQDLLKRSLQTDNPRLRRHVHATRDRLEALRRSLPPPEPPPQRDDYHPRRDLPTQQVPRVEGGPPAAAPPQQQQQQYPRDDRRDDRRDRRPPPRDDRPRDDRPRDNRPPPPPREDPGQIFLKTGKATLGDLLKAKLKDKG